MAFTDVILNPPADLAEWNDLLTGEYGFHVKYRKRLRQMHRMHKRKGQGANKMWNDHNDYPQYFQKQYVDGGMTPLDAQTQVAADKIMWDGKRKHLASILKCLRAEHEIRDLLELDSRYVVEPDERDIKDDEVLEPDTAVITTIDLSITRSPIG